METMMTNTCPNGPNECREHDGVCFGCYQPCGFGDQNETQSCCCDEMVGAFGEICSMTGQTHNYGVSLDHPCLHCGVLFSQASSSNTILLPVKLKAIALLGLRMVQHG
jgi:hypothetical protein